MPFLDPEKDSNSSENAGAQSSSQAAPQEERTNDVSPDAQDRVQEFMAEAAQQNEAANAELANGAEGAQSDGPVAAAQCEPEPYISFEHVYKLFGSLELLKDVSIFVMHGETLRIHGITDV